jgi:hypothetical protein
LQLPNENILFRSAVWTQPPGTATPAAAGSARTKPVVIDGDNCYTGFTAGLWGAMTPFTEVQYRSAKSIGQRQRSPRAAIVSVTKVVT